MPIPAIDTRRNLPTPSILSVRRVTASSSEDLATAALQRVELYSDKYSFSAAPLSPKVGLTGNAIPEETPLSWLKNRSKCNVFVGDVLTDAGFEMPTLKMRDGTLHYANAEILPRYTQHFQKIDRLEQLRPGDLIVMDWGQSGENGAHVEVVTGFNWEAKQLKLTGAHRDGAYERDRSQLLNKLDYDLNNKVWKLVNANVYLLRAFKRLYTRRQ